MNFDYRELLIHSKICSNWLYDPNSKGGKERCAVQHSHDFEQQQILSRADLGLIGIGVSNSTLLRWEAHGRFPRRIRMAKTSVAWFASEIEQWLKDLSSERKHHHYEDPI
jgi:predicted DNA-binding transcriptional regulator AlpA